MKDMKQIFILGLVVGMILGGMIIVLSFFLGNSFLGFNTMWTKQELAPYFRKNNKNFLSANANQPPYRIKKIDRDGKNYVYILKGGEKENQVKDKMHPNKSPIKVAPL